MPATEFSSLTPPDVQNDTRIIAVVGIDNEDDAAPDNDGWFISDFYLFNHLLAGLGHSQKWFTCLNPSDLVQKYTEYVHGNPLESRRVVLDSSIIPHDIEIVGPEHVCDRFLQYVRQESDAARISATPLLIFIFGHGDEHTKGVCIGTKPPKKSFRWLKHSEFRDAIGEGVSVCTVMTSRYSGGWSTNPDLNTTILPAAGSDVQSEAWTASNSIGRACGSIYATILRDTLCIMEEENYKDPSKMRSYKDLTATIEDTMLSSVDRLWDTHEIQFSAQDDRWGMEWRKGTGFPLAGFEQRWSNLRAIPPLIGNPDFNRDPINRPTRSQINAWCAAHPTVQGDGSHVGLGRATLRGRFGGSIRSYSRFLTGLARCYMATKPGRDTLAPNVPLHNLAKRCMRGEALDIGDLGSLHAGIEYRMSLMRTATLFLIGIGVEAEKCHRWDKDEWLQTNQGRREQYQDIVTQLHKHHLYPEPTRAQSHAFHKPTHYWAAMLSELDLSPAVLTSKIEQMVACK